VTKTKAKKKLCSQVATKEDYVPVEVKEKKKTKGGKLGEISGGPEDPEQQQQQQQVAGQVTVLSKLLFLLCHYERTC